jgi:hypothetical protein
MVSDIDAEIEAAGADLEKRQGELEAAQAKVVEVESLYELKSVEAITYNDASARKWLEKSDRELAVAQSAVRQLTAVVKEIGERISQLKSDKVAAIRAGIEQQIEADEDGLIADCLAVDSAAEQMILSRNAVYARRDRLVALSSQLGLDTRKYEKISVHMRRSVNQQVFDGGDNPWMPRPTKDLYNQSFSKFVENMLRPEPNWQGVDVAELTTTPSGAS